MIVDVWYVSVHIGARAEDCGKCNAGCGPTIGIHWVSPLNAWPFHR